MTGTAFVIRLADGRLVARNGYTKGDGPVSDDPTQAWFYRDSATATNSMRGLVRRYSWVGATVVSVRVELTTFEG